jgi:hypothetical protein
MILFICFWDLKRRCRICGAISVFEFEKAVGGFEGCREGFGVEESEKTQKKLDEVSWY